MIQKACCGKPTCMKNGTIFMKATDDNWETCIQNGIAIMKLADDKCDNCNRECRNCPPSEGDYMQEFLFHKIEVSAQHAQKKQGAGDYARPLDQNP